MPRLPLSSSRRLFLGLTGLGCAAAGAAETAKVEFNRDIRPILSENCFNCHGPDKSHRKAGLRLDQREEATKELKSGDTAIVPGDVKASQLLDRLVATDPEEVMPPPDTHKTISPAQRETLKRWIAQGAEYQAHWAYLPPTRPPVPEVKAKAAVRNPLDAFILEKLESKSIAPSAEADRRELLRRVSLDLTGLPPTPAEVRAFLKEPDPAAAYERAVDRLLASPQYGERMAVPWLDLVRYADTVGYHGDQNMNVFPYRDYVIDAFNSNKPFDQFTVEQIAGDLLPNPTREQKLATCFNRLNMVTREGGAQPKEYLAKYAADRVRTISGAWLGSTMGCAECHDHKFDPFSTKDFYTMAAFFADIKQWGVYTDYSYTPNPDLRGFTNEYPFPPEMVVPSPALQRREAALRARLKELADGVAAKAPAKFAQWRTGSAAALEKMPGGWSVLQPVVAPPPVAAGKPEPKIAQPPFALEGDGRVVFAPKAPPTSKLTFSLPLPQLTALRLEILPGGKTGAIFREAPKGTTLKLKATLTTGGKERPLTFRAADANYKEPRYVSGAEIIGINAGWPIGTGRPKEAHTAIWLLDQPLPVSAGGTLTVSLEGNTFGTLRVSASTMAPTNLRDAAAPPDLSSVGWLRSTAPDPAAFRECQILEGEIAQTRGGEARVLITETIPPAVTRVLPRGNWQDESGEPLSPAVPHFLPQVNRPGLLNRLDLAKWLVSAENPLTARVFVNRLWKQFFGAGISGVVDDLGAQGEWPTHPELLDWLAVEFRESGWNVKHLVKLIVQSATYRQDANLRPPLRDLDPNNRWLASQNPRRLEAEFVRDNALSIAGLLNLDLGGPSSHPYQPANYYENLQFPNRTYEADTGPLQYRRGLYTHWQRTFLHPMLANFDAPSRDECTAARTVANTPQQALTLLNDPTFMEAARAFAGRLLSEPAANDGARLGAAFELALARPIKPREQESLSAFLAEQRGYFRAHPDDAKKLLLVGNSPAPSQTVPAELAAWAMVARVVLNLHETITRY